MTKISPKISYEESIFKPSHLLQKKINQIFTSFQIFEQEREEE
jgi:hypothetical protein